MKTIIRLEAIVSVDVDVSDMAIPAGWLNPDFDVETVKVPFKLRERAMEQIWDQKGSYIAHMKMIQIEGREE